jgi:hypothetical protein
VNSFETGAIVTHTLYPNLVGEVLDVHQRFGLLVRWQSESRAMRHLCDKPQRHPPEFLVLASEWKSIPKTSEGLNCMESEELDTNSRQHAPVMESETPEIIEEPLEEAIEESLLSEPLPTEEAEDLEKECEYD